MKRTITISMVVVVDDEDVQPDPDFPTFEGFADGFEYICTNLERDDFWWDADATVVTLKVTDSEGQSWTPLA